MLKVIGIAAPHWVSRGTDDKSFSLNSRDPFSLYNAYRYAAGKAEDNDPVWSNSNWCTKEGRTNSIMLVDYFEDEIEDIKTKLLKEKPDLLLIGSMSISFAGAIQIATIAKEILKDKVFVVLGGKHTIETVYIKNGQVVNHEASPLKLMNEGTIPRCFELVISGDGEYTIYNVGNIIHKLISNNEPLQNFYTNVKMLEDSKGNWVIGWIEDDKIKSLVSKGLRINYDELPLIAELFPIRAKFSVFNADLTAHAYSDISKGCIYDCFYCSERNGINGKVSSENINTAPMRLMNQFKKIVEVGKKEYNVSRMSAFVEDSILLTGNRKALEELNELLEKEKLDIEFGGQFTVDTLLKNKDIIYNLSKNGFKYVFFGIETLNEQIAQTMSKNVSNGNKWINKNEEVISYLTSIGMKCGVSILFGLGETQQNRLDTLDCIEGWMKKYNSPCVISMNWAVQHPLRGSDDELNYNYVNWGTPKESPYLNIFTEMFGEASLNYCLKGINLPTIEEFQEIRKKYKKLSLEN